MSTHVIGETSPLHQNFAFSCKNPTASHNGENRFLVSQCCNTAVCVKCFQEALKEHPGQINLENPTNCCTKKNSPTDFHIINISQNVLQRLAVWQLLEQLGD